MLEASKVPTALYVDAELQDHLRSLVEEVVDNLNPGICSAAHRVARKPPQRGYSSIPHWRTRER